MWVILYCVDINRHEQDIGAILNMRLSSEQSPQDQPQAPRQPQDQPQPSVGIPQGKSANEETKESLKNGDEISDGKSTPKKRSLSRESKKRNKVPADQQVWPLIKICSVCFYKY